MPPTSVKLSLCIPTHDGRGWCLAEALGSMIADVQASGLAGIVEVCVSDNGSRDDTQAVVAAAQERAPGLITYFRFPLSVGIYSWLNVVEMARGEYCWLFGSDDVIEPGAIRGVLERLERYHGCGGMTASYDHYDFRLQQKLPKHPLNYYPSDYDHERMITGFDDCLFQLGMAQAFMSVQVFRRELWLAVVAAEDPDFVHYSWNYSHVYVLARMMQRDANWVWSPLVVTKMRGDNGEVPQRLGTKAYFVPLGYLRDMTSIWSRVCGANRVLYRRVLTKALRLTWSSTVVRHLKLSVKQTSSDDFLIFGQFTRYLWPLPQFWLKTFPALLIPQWFWKTLSRMRSYGAIKERVLRKSTDAPSRP